MKDGEEEKRWVLCPWCGSKTRLQILQIKKECLPLRPLR